MLYVWDIDGIWSSCQQFSHAGNVSRLTMPCRALKVDTFIKGHDEVRDISAKISKEISNDVETEPHLLPLTGESLSSSSNSANEARLDFSVRGFWQRGQRAFFDVRIFNPFAPSYRNQNLSNAFKSNERIKKRAYGQRVIEVEQGSFSHLIFTPYGGTSRETEHFITTLS